MTESSVLKYILENQFELNLSYMPFILHGGIFVPTNDDYNLGQRVSLELKLPSHAEIQVVECRVIWITPKNSLHHVYQGVGLQFMGENAKHINELIQANLDSAMDVGGYTYGMGISTEPQHSA